MKPGVVSRLPFVVALATLPAAAAPAAGQTRPEPQLLLTIVGGVSSGSNLWEINRQPFARRLDAATVDTLRLTRSLQSALVLGASATIFPKPNLGLSGEILYLGYDLNDVCTAVFIDPALVNAGENEQICADISRTGSSAVALGFSGGLLYRFASRSFASPYVRLQGGITVRSSSTVEMQGRFLLGNSSQVRLVIDDPRGGSLSPTALGGLGIMIPFARGYQARLEVRDQLLLVRRATGPADNLLVPPTGTKLVHSAGLLIQLDVVLEQRRGRRY
jgi:hypothetical protein